MLSDPVTRAQYDRGAPLSSKHTAAAMQIDPAVVQRRADLFQARYMRRGGGRSTPGPHVPPPWWDRAVRWAAQPRLTLLLPLFAATTWYLAHGGGAQGPVYSATQVTQVAPPAADGSSAGTRKS